MIQSGGLLGRLLGPLLKTGLRLMKSVIKPLAKSVLISLGLTAAASAADAGIHKKILGSDHNNNTTLIISNDEMEDILKIVKSLEDSGVLLKGVSEEQKKQREGFLSMLLGTLGASLLGDVLSKSLSGEGTIRAGYWLWFIGNKNIITNIFRIQAYDSIICGYFCIGFINFMF